MEYREGRKEITKEINRKYHENNRERMNAKSRAYNPGYQAENKEKIAKKSKEWRDSNKEAISLKDKKYREKNKEKLSQTRRKYREKNKEIISEKKRKYHIENPHIKAASRLRRENRLLEVGMRWEEEKTALVARTFYKEARELEKLTGIEWEVDHKYPISGEVVSGLHVHNNLQVIPAWLNGHKKNAFILTESDEWVGYLERVNPELYKSIEEFVPMVCEINNRFL